MKVSPEAIAQNEYRDYAVYRALADAETNPEFRRILSDLADQECRDYESWRQLSSQKNFTASWRRILFAKAARKILGLSFTARYFHRREEKTIRELEAMLPEAPHEFRERIQATLEHERANEARLIAEIKEEKVEFLSSIILGLNDGLIELTGALVGFSFALVGTRLVALTGSITGIAASLSMASSAYMQARHEENGKDPVKAALYTGVSYFIVVVLLVTPFLLSHTIMPALLTMFAIIVLIISAISYYTAVIFDRNFGVQFRQMIFFSLGVSAVAFLIGSVFRRLTGVAI